MQKRKWGEEYLKSHFVLSGVGVKLLVLCVLLDISSRIDDTSVALCHTDRLLAPPAADSDGESDGSDRVPVPSFQNSFSQAFEKALLELDNGPASPPQPVVVSGL